MNTKILQIESIGQRLTIARENAKISKSQLTDKMHLSRSICGKWEKGDSNPSTAHLIKLAKVLNVSFEWLATGVENKNEKTTLTQAEKETLHNTQVAKVTEIMQKMNSKQKDSLVNFLGDMTI